MSVKILRIGKENPKEDLLAWVELESTSVKLGNIAEYFFPMEIGATVFL